MRTLKQIEAARMNGAKSKGPVTAEGKARVAQNGTRHGIYSKRVVLQNEDPAAYIALRDELLADWNPASAFERDLIIDIAEARWRLSRFTALETAAIDYQIEDMRPAVAESYEQMDQDTSTVLAFNELVVNNRTFEVLQATIRQQHRIIDRATSQLLRLRKIRPDGGTTAPTTHVGAPESSAILEQHSPAANAPISGSKPEPSPFIGSDSGNDRTKPEPQPVQASKQSLACSDPQQELESPRSGFCKWPHDRPAPQEERTRNYQSREPSH